MAPASAPKPARFDPPPEASHASSSSHLLGLRESSLPALIRSIGHGLPWSSVKSLAAASGLSQQEIATFLGIPPRTFARRRNAGSLDPAESERLLRLAEVFSAATGLYAGDRATARQWLASPVLGLGNARPLDFARTEIGAREVRNLIGRLENGIFT